MVLTIIKNHCPLVSANTVVEISSKKSKKTNPVFVWDEKAKVFEPILDPIIKQDEPEKVPEKVTPPQIVSKPIVKAPVKAKAAVKSKAPAKVPIKKSTIDSKNTIAKKTDKNSVWSWKDVIS